jgi:hypothetical protein
MESLWVLFYVFSVVVVIVGVFIGLYHASNKFDGFTRLPIFFDEKVYSFFYLEEAYPDVSAYQLSPKSQVYNITNPIDQVQTSIIWIPSQQNNVTNKNLPLLVMLRGNGKITYFMKAIEGIQAVVDVNVVVVCYRGSFEELSHDQPCRSKILSDNVVAWKFIQDQFAFEEYYVYGLSIGTGIATDFIKQCIIDKPCLSRKRLAGVILNNVFQALDDSFVWSAVNSGIDHIQLVPQFLLGLFSKGLLAVCGEVYPNLRNWKMISSKLPDLPILVFSSGNDKVMPPQDGQTIANTMKNNTYVLVEGADHGSANDHPIFYTEIANFIK